MKDDIVIVGAARTPVGNLWMAVAGHYGSHPAAIGESNGIVDFFA